MKCDESALGHDGPAGDPLRLDVRCDGEGGMIEATVLGGRMLIGEDVDWLARRLRRLVEGGGCPGVLLLDLSRVQHVSGAMLGVIAGLARDLRRAGGRLTIRAEGFTLGLFAISRLDRVVDVIDVGGEGPAPRVA